MISMHRCIFNISLRCCMYVWLDKWYTVEIKSKIRIWKWVKHTCILSVFAKLKINITSFLGNRFFWPNSPYSLRWPDPYCWGLISATLIPPHCLLMFQNFYIKVYEKKIWCDDVLVSDLPLHRLTSQNI